jgi:Rieske Fe-S protein
MDQGGIYFARLKPRRDYAIAFTTEDDLPTDMYIGSGEIPYSIRTYNNMVVFAGEMHPVGHGNNMKNHYDKLINAAKNLFKVKDIKYKWSTQDNFTPDGIPYIGKLTPNSENIYVATGFNGWGMTGGTLSAMVLKDYVQGLKNPLMEIVNPFRGQLFKSGGKLIKQNLHIGKMFLKDKLGKAEVESIDDIPEGEGRIVKIKGEKIAVYKDEKGKLIKLSAKCPHMGCTVNWNSAEKSWDCPCHGSRFDKEGKAIHGPALARLEKKKD